jgi:drug/metabolite transporter (DMT)-like permease
MKLPVFRPDVADAAMLSVVLLWAANNILIKVTVDVLPPLPFVVGRFLIVIALVWAWIAWRRLPARIALPDWPLLLVAGVCGFGIHNALFTISMQHTSAFSAALLLSLSPIFTMLLARVIGMEHPTSAQWLATGLAAAGVLVFVGDKLRVGGFGTAALGDLLSLVSAFIFAVYSLAAKPLTARYGALVTTAWAVVVGLLVVAPWGFGPALDEAWLELPLPVWGALVYAAVVSMLIGYSLWSWAMNRGRVARTAPYLFLIPVATGIISAVALGEHFTPVKIGGALMVLAGTTLVRVLGRRVVAPAATSEDVSAPAAVAVARGTN